MQAIGQGSPSVVSVTMSLQNPIAAKLPQLSLDSLQKTSFRTGGVLWPLWTCLNLTDESVRLYSAAPEIETGRRIPRPLLARAMIDRSVDPAKVEGRPCCLCCIPAARFL